MRFGRKKIQDDKDKIRMLIGYLWYFMTTHMGYNGDMDILNNIMMEIIFQNTMDPGAPQRDPNGIAKARKLVEMIWTDIYLVEGVGPKKKRSWEAAWGQFIQVLPVEKDVKKVMVEDLAQCTSYKKYIEYIEYIIETSTQWHPATEWYAAFYPLLNSTPR